MASELLALTLSCKETSPHISPMREARAWRCRRRQGARRFGRAGVLDSTSTDSPGAECVAPLRPKGCGPGMACNSPSRGDGAVGRLARSIGCDLFHKFDLFHERRAACGSRVYPRPVHATQTAAAKAPRQSTRVRGDLPERAYRGSQPPSNGLPRVRSENPYHPAPPPSRNLLPDHRSP